MKNNKQKNSIFDGIKIAVSTIPFYKGMPVVWQEQVYNLFVSNHSACVELLAFEFVENEGIKLFCLPEDRNTVVGWVCTVLRNEANRLEKQQIF